jgi:hypothetical protein
MSSDLMLWYLNTEVLLAEGAGETHLSLPLLRTPLRLEKKN